MDSNLTEIKNAHLFMEYLMCIGAKSPHSRRDDWELVDIDKKKSWPELKKTPTATQNSLFVPHCSGVNDVLMSDLLNFR